MKIAFFTDDYLPHIHGVATSIKTYREALERLGHEVYIIAPNKPGHDDHDDHIIRMPSINNYVFEKRPTSVIYPGLAKKLDKYEFDVVHSHMQFYLGLLAMSVAKRQGVPHFTTIHSLYTELIDDYPLMISAGLIAVTFGYPIMFRCKPILPFKDRSEIRDLRKEDAKSIMKRQGWRLTAEFANRCDYCISPSKHLAEILTNAGLTTPSSVFPNCIDTSRYTSATTENSPLTKLPGEKYIVCVARLSAEKRQHVLIDAMEQLNDPCVKLVLVGNGPTEDELIASVASRGLSDQVIFTGALSGDQVASILKQADLFVLASYHFDNQPMVFLEAAACGLPIVYCDERMTEGLTPKNAVLTDGIEGDAFAKVFADLLGDDKKRAELSAGALKVAKNFDSTKMAKDLVALYESAIRTKELEKARE